MIIIQKNIKEIKPYAKNAKLHSESQVKKIAESIKAFGFRQPIVIDKNSEIIVGHGRFEAAKILKLEKVPCIDATDLTEEEVKAYRLADNKLNESDWDMDLVIEEMGKLDIEFQALTGFDSDDLKIDLSDANEEIEIDNLKTKHECPKCGFAF